MKHRVTRIVLSNLPRRTNCPLVLCIVGLALLMLSRYGLNAAGIAYGSINNFDTVNDTGVPCHGFEIELDDIHSADVTYTYDWNHYGTPKITEDIVVTAGVTHTNTHVRYAAVWTNTGWSAYTAVPTAPIPPTQGHQFTNPGTNFGGEHFGVGFRAQPASVKYNWLVDDGAHNLALGPAVSVSTPTFTYIPPAGGGAPAQVQAAIVPPPAPVFYEFGDATWVKEIRTTTHNNHEIKIRNLVDPDPENPDNEDWRNGEPDEVEAEWQILQLDTATANGGANGELVGAPENLNQGDEVVTRRYEFYDYTGPYDAETHEALVQTVAPDGSHGTGTYSNTVIVGNFLGAQMSAIGAGAPLGLIDHLPEGELNSTYPTRSVVIAGDTNFTVSTSGLLPDGLVFDAASGQIAGTPVISGEFLFTVSVFSSNSPALTRHYPLLIAPAGAVLPPHSFVDTLASPPDKGTTSGDGVYTNGTPATIQATPNPGYAFAGWSENGAWVSYSATNTFTNLVNRSLVARFVSNNSPPLFQAIQPRTAYVQSELRVTNSVFDPLFPKSTFHFSLGPDAPTRASIGTNDGVFRWCPARSQAASSNLITIVATSLAPSGTTRRATNSFVVQVTDYLEFSLGQAVLKTGQTMSIPLQLTTTAGLTNMTAWLWIPSARLANLALLSPAPNLTATLGSGPDAYLLGINLNGGQTLQGTQTVAELSFQALAGSSCFVPLQVSTVTGRLATGGQMPRTLANGGRVVVVGQELLLEAWPATNGQRTVVVYGPSGTNFVLESSTNLISGAWHSLQPTTISSGLSRPVTVPVISSVEFYRARQL